MRLSRFLLLSLLFVLCLTAASGQMCGKFRIAVFVRDEAGKPINSGVIQFLPITKDETLGKRFVRDASDLSLWTIEFIEGSSVTEFHRLIVSADGYQTAENEIKFFSCRGSRLTVKLPPKTSAARPVWNFENSLMVSTEDEQGKGVSRTKMIIKQGAQTIETKDSEYYGTGFSLPNGEYILRVEKDGFEPAESKLDLTKIADVSVTVKLKPKIKS